MATVESKVGPQTVSDGTTTQARLGKAAEAVVQDAHSRFYESNYRSKRFVATSAVAGVAGQEATSLAASCALALCNPTNSGVNAVIDKLTIGLISGTAGVCAYVWAVYAAQGNTAAAGTAITPKAANLSSAASACTAGTGSNVVGGAPTLLRATGLSTGANAGGANMPEILIENVDGGIILPPGQALVLFGAGAAGTSEKNIYSLEWEEVPV